MAGTTICVNWTLVELGLTPGGYTPEELTAAVEAYAVTTYGAGALVNNAIENGDGTVHVCGSY